MSIDNMSNYLIENDFVVRLSKKYVWTCNKRRKVAYYVQLIKYLKEPFFLHKTFWQHGLYFYTVILLGDFFVVNSANFHGEFATTNTYASIYEY